MAKISIKEPTMVDNYDIKKNTKIVNQSGFSKNPNQDGPKGFPFGNKFRGE